MIISMDADSLKNYNEFVLKFERRMFYGYDGPEDGFYKWLNSKQQEFKSSNKQGSVPFKNGRKILAGNGDSTLLCIEKRNNLLQDTSMSIPSGGTFTITLQEPWDKARQDWYSLCKTNEIKI